MTAPTPSVGSPTCSMPPVPQLTDADRRVWLRSLRRRAAEDERRRLSGDLLVALVVGVVISAATVTVQWKLDRDAAVRSEALATRAEAAAQARDDLRFVREAASAGPVNAARPFDGFELSGATLSGLPLGCDDPWGNQCTSFAEASLADAVLYGTDLRGASFEGADLRGATFDRADVSSADFREADLRGATFHAAIVSIVSPDFSGSDLRGTDFSPLSDARWPREGYDFLQDTMLDVNFERVCWDSTTVWPQEFEPPPSAPDACRPG